MDKTFFPDKDVFIVLLYDYSNEFYNENNSIWSKFFTIDPYDNTSVFDFIDDNWIDYTYSNIQNVILSDLYKGDGSIEYRIAYIAVNLCLLHSLPNGNKRTALLVMFLLLVHNGLDKPLGLDFTIYYDFVKKVATEGVDGRVENIEELTDILKVKTK